MKLSLLFWIIMVVGFLFTGYSNRTTLKAWASTDLVVWILFALIGWEVFGPVVTK